MGRPRYQRGTLRTSAPRHKDQLERKLPRGEFWALWWVYVLVDGKEKRRPRQMIITREIAEGFGIAKDYNGPLTKADAQRILDLLIARDSGTLVQPDKTATVAMVAKEYLDLAKPNWGTHMVKVAGALVEKHIINGKIGNRPVVEVGEPELQAWLNEYVAAGASHSLLRKLLVHIRGIWKHARKKEITAKNPTEDLRAKSKKRVSQRTLSVEECQRLLSALIGRDRLIVRMFIQLGLRPEEMFALRRDDVMPTAVRIDEALVEGEIADTKTEASNSFVFLPPDLAMELRDWMDTSAGDPTDWLFQTKRGRRGFLDSNNYRNRILQPAAIRARVGLQDTGDKGPDGKPILKTDVDFRVLRRTCATLFGDKAKDPKSTQAQMRHADPSITLKHYQKSIPASVQAAAIALESDLFPKSSDRVLIGSKFQ